MSPSAGVLVALVAYWNARSGLDEDAANEMLIRECEDLGMSYSTVRKGIELALEWSPSK